eukprot:g4056.t1
MSLKMEEETRILLMSKGFHFSLEGVSSLMKGMKSIDIDILVEKSLDADFNRFGTPVLPSPIPSTQVEFASLVVLQIVSIRNVRQSRTSQDSSPCLLLLTLTDGNTECPAIVLDSPSPIVDKGEKGKSASSNSLSINTPPGTKIGIINATIEHGYIRLRRESIAFVAGKVKELLALWTQACQMRAFRENGSTRYGALPKGVKPPSFCEFTGISQSHNNTDDAIKKGSGRGRGSDVDNSETKKSEKEKTKSLQDKDEVESEEEVEKHPLFGTVKASVAPYSKSSGFSVREVIEIQKTNMEKVHTKNIGKDLTPPKVTTKKKRSKAKLQHKALKRKQRLQREAEKKALQLSQQRDREREAEQKKMWKSRVSKERHYFTALNRIALQSIQVRLNFAWKRWCEWTSTERQSVQGVAEKAQMVLKATEMHREKEKKREKRKEHANSWICTVCTYRNENKIALVCSICKSKRKFDAQSGPSLDLEDRQESKKKEKQKKNRIKGKPQPTEKECVKHDKNIFNRFSELLMSGKKGKQNVSCIAVIRKIELVDLHRPNAPPQLLLFLDDGHGTPLSRQSIIAAPAIRNFMLGIPPNAQESLEDIKQSIAGRRALQKRVQLLSNRLKQTPTKQVFTLHASSDVVFTKSQSLQKISGVTVVNISSVPNSKSSNK